MQRLIAVIGLLLVGASGFGLDLAAPQQTDVTALVEKAERDSDLDAALALVTDLQTRVAVDPIEENQLLLGRACLVAAEVRRYDYEKATDMDPRDRRLLGRSIDDVAHIGHDALDALHDDNSEKWRIKADLYGTMIRSLYKGNKYVDEMESATRKALEFGPKNPNSLLTASKRPLFAEKEHGGNIPEALELLDRAIEIDPKFERAHAFRGIAYEALGRMDEAVAEWKLALELNPKSRLATDKLNARKDVAK